jgi:hypothetical protein
MGGRGARMRLKIELGLALGIGLILGGIFLRVRLAGLDLMVVVEHTGRDEDSTSSDAASTTSPLCRAGFQTSASVGKALLSWASLQNSA